MSYRELKFFSLPIISFLIILLFVGWRGSAPREGDFACYPVPNSILSVIYADGRDSYAPQEIKVDYLIKCTVTHLARNRKQVKLQIDDYLIRFPDCANYIVFPPSDSLFRKLGYESVLDPRGRESAKIKGRFVPLDKLLNEGNE